MLTSKSLTQSEIKQIKETIAHVDSKFVEDVTDAEVWDYVQDRQDMLNDKAFNLSEQGKGIWHWVSWKNAVSSSY